MSDMTGPNGIALAIDWEAEACLRARARDLNRSTAWPSPTTIGVASMKACALNSRALEPTATFWVQHSDKPCTIPINDIRHQAWLGKQKLT